MLIDEAYKAGERSLAQYGSRTPEESQAAPLGSVAAPCGIAD